jgi:RNA polymerase sigma-70 factor (ECF subfamily)
MLRLGTGHDAALNDLMQRHGGRLCGYLVRCLQNEDDAADIAQETFVRVYQNRGKFDPQKKFSTWLYAIATNLVRDRYRWRTRHQQVSLDAEQQETGTPFGEQLVDDCLAPGERLQSSERAEAVRKAVAALPEELSTPLILAEYEDRSQAEIGEILGCTAKAVETRIYRARKQLREMLGALVQQ